MRKFNVNVNGKAYYVEIEEADVNAKPVVSSAPAKAPTEAPAAAAVAAPAAKPESGSTVVVAPMPGQILELCLSNGAKVNKGDKIVILEAMKMENEIVASASGTLTYLVKKGDAVDTGSQLAYIK